MLAGLGPTASSENSRLRDSTSRPRDRAYSYSRFLFPAAFAFAFASPPPFAFFLAAHTLNRPSSESVRTSSSAASCSPCIAAASLSASSIDAIVDSDDEPRSTSTPCDESFASAIVAELGGEDGANAYPLRGGLSGLALLHARPGAKRSRAEARAFGRK